MTMDALLDFTRPLDVTLFDQVVNSLYQGSGQQVGVVVPRR